ncbi:unnamed protein product, partial [Symbiodinium natans]
VSLLSGRSASLEVEPEELVETLKARAEKTLAVGKGRLVGSSGDILDGAASVE